MAHDITILSQPSGNPVIQFSGSVTQGDLRLEVDTIGDVSFIGNSGTLLHIDDTLGRIGIGTSVPGSRLHLEGSGGTLFTLNNTDAGKAGLKLQSNGTTKGLIALSGLWEGDSSTDLGIIAETGTGIRFYTGGSSTEKAVILSTGEMGIGVTNPGHLLTLKDTGDFGTATFISGITGDGFRIDDGGSNGVTLEIDNITVRNTLRTHIFQKDVVKATNGILYVSDSGVISGSTGTTGAGTVTFRDDKSATFVADDELWFKDADEDTGNIVGVKFSIDNPLVTSTPGTGLTKYNVTAISSSLVNIRTGGTAVRTSGGTVVIDASSADSPYMDVVTEGVTVVRTGNLDGITSTKFGALSGWGQWASGSIYLEGSINATSGYIGDWVISTTLTGGNISLAPGDHIAIGATAFETGNGIWLGNDGKASFGNAGGARLTWDGTNVEVHNSSGTALVTLGTTNEIAGWTINSSQIYKGSLVLDATLGSIRTATNFSTGDGFFLSGSDTNNFRVGIASGQRMQFTGTNLEIYNSADAKLVSLGATNEIAGWTITTSQIYKGSLVIDSTLGSIRTTTNFSTGDGFFLSGSDTNNFRVGIASGQRLQFTGTNVEIYNADNAKLVSLGATNEIAGWGITSTAISSSGQEIIISSGDKRITVNDGSQDRIYLGEVDGGTVYGLKIFDGVGTADGNRLVELGQGDNMIAGWTLTSGSLSNANAILYAVGMLSLGSGTDAYNSANRIFIDGVNSRMSIGTGFRYTGGTLTVDGSATIGGFTIGSAIYNGRTALGAGTGIYLGTDGIALGATASPAEFSVLADGTLNATSATITGDITATTANISGSIYASEINAVTGRLQDLDIDGTITIQSGGSLVAGDTTLNSTSLTIDGTASSIKLGSGAFWAKGSGQVTASNAQILGNITAETINATGSGVIGGWTLGATTLTGGAVTLGSTGYIEVGTLAGYTDVADTSTGAWFDDGGSFLLKAGGANTGYIQGTGGNFIIKANDFDLSATGVSISSSGKRFTAGSSNAIVIMDGDEGIWSGNATRTSAPFSVDLAGNLTASNVDLSGEITATSGTIGSFTIGTYLYTGAKTAWNDTEAGVHIGSDGIGIGNNVFTVNGSTGALVATSATIDGDIVAVSIQADSGSIAGWEFDSNKFHRDGFTIDSSTSTLSTDTGSEQRIVISGNTVNEFSFYDSTDVRKFYLSGNYDGNGNAGLYMYGGMYIFGDDSSADLVTVDLHYDVGTFSEGHSVLRIGLNNDAVAGVTAPSAISINLDNDDATSHEGVGITISPGINGIGRPFYSACSTEAYLYGPLRMGGSATTTISNVTPLDIYSGSGAGHISLENADSGGNTFIMGVTDTAETVYGSAGSFFIREGGNTRFVIESGGDVGFGTTNPSTNLHVQENVAGTTPQLEIENLSTTGDSAIQLTIPGDSYAIGIDNSDNDLFQITYSSTTGAAVMGTNVRLSIDNGGYVGIGTENATTIFDVYSSAVSGILAGRIRNANVGTSADAALNLDIVGQSFTLGVDATDDSFVISDGTSLHAAPRLAISVDGNVTKPSNCAFLVTRITSDQTITASNTTQWIDWNSAEYDINGDVDIVTDNDFTAPVDGRYAFDVTLRINTVTVASTNYILGIYVNGVNVRSTIRDYGHFGTGATDLTYWSMTLSSIEELSLGDTVKIRIFQNGGASVSAISSGAGYTSWSGYLLG